MRPIALAVVLMVSPALAEDAAPPPAEPGAITMVGAMVGTNYIGGNVNQLRLTFGGTVSYSDGDFGNDLVVSGFRLWLGQPDKRTDFTKVGDALSITDMPYYYFHPKIFGYALGLYEVSESAGYDSRYSVGGGAGYALMRSAEGLVRFGLGVQYEHTDFVFDIFNKDVEHDGSVRDVVRGLAFTNGWYQDAKAGWSVNWLAWFQPGLADFADYRLHVDTSVQTRLIGNLALNLSVNYDYNSVTLLGAQSDDVRITAGLAYNAVFGLPGQ